MRGLTSSIRLFDVSGNPIEVLDGYASVSGQSGLMVAGYDRAALATRFLNIDASGNLIVTNPGSSPSSLSGFVCGYIATASVAIAAIRATTYTEQSANAQRNLISSSANDSSAGTGARTVKITYYTAAGEGPLSEVVTMNGTTQVTTVASNICFIEKMEVVTVGSNNSNVGVISIRTAAAAVIWSIAAGDNQTLGIHHYVANNKTCYITGASVGHNGTTVGSGAIFLIKNRPVGVANAAEIQVSDYIRLFGQSSTHSRVYQSPIKIVGPSRLIMYVIPESGSAFTFRAAFDYYEQ